MTFFAGLYITRSGRRRPGKRSGFGRDRTARSTQRGVHLVHRGFLRDLRYRSQNENRHLLAVLLIAGGLWMRFQPARVTRVVHAQTGCSVAGLVGSYGYSLSGFYFDNAGNTNFFSASGIFTADGQGNTTGHESDSFSGQVVQADPISGTYRVSSDCSGSFTTNSMSRLR